MYVRQSLIAGLVACLAGASTGCSGDTPGDPAAFRICQRTDFLKVEDFGVNLTASGHPKLVAAYSSTGNVLNTWDPTNHEHPMFSMWRGEADGRSMAACFFDGSFRTLDGRTFGRVLVETDGARYRLIVADKRSVVPTSRPRRA